MFLLNPEIKKKPSGENAKQLQKPNLSPVAHSDQTLDLEAVDWNICRPTHLQLIQMLTHFHEKKGKHRSIIKSLKKPTGVEAKGL